MLVVATKLLTLHVGDRLWLLRAALLETWVLVNKVCTLASLAASQLAPQGFSCRAVIEGGALVDAEVDVVFLLGAFDQIQVCSLNIGQPSCRAVLCVMHWPEIIGGS
jgi:hypothetical protein